MEIRDRVKMPFKFKIGIVLIFMALSTVSVFNPMDFYIEAFHFEIRLDFLEKGVTEISIPPLGSIGAKTHKAPIRIQINLKNIDLNLLAKFLEGNTEEQEIIASVAAKIKKIVVYFSLRVLLLAFIGGMIGTLLLRFTTPKTILKGGILGLLMMGALLAGIYTTFQREAFGSPHFTGALKAAPWMVGLAEEAFSRRHDFNEQMRIVADNLVNMFERLETFEPLGSTNGEVRILHVSDIHNNSSSFDLIELVIKEFEVDFIIDTGDLTDFGTSLEGIFNSRLAALPVPYIFIPGNHDSPATIESVKKYKNVIVLDEEVVELNGIKVYGLADAASLGYELITPADEKFPGSLDNVIDFLVDENINIIAVHRPSVARKLAGLAPVILNGHDHRQQIQRYKDSVIIDAGTTGAAGIRGLQVLNEIPKTLVLLHYNHIEDELKLTAADIIALSEATRRLSLERFVF